jgi:hypothetical protein
MADVLFYGRVLPGGLLVWDSPKDYNRAVRALAGKHVEGILRKRRTKRSSQANRYYFGVVVKILAEHCGYDPQEMHEALAFRFLRIEDCPITGAPRRKHTPETDSTEFSEYVNHCIRLAAELGVVIPDANEVAA